MNRPHRRKVALLIALVVVLTQSQAHLAFAGLGPGGLTTGDLTYHGTAVMPNPTNYLIFWLPGGSSFEPAGSAYTDGQFEGLEQHYFQDVCGTPYYNTLTPLSFDPANPTAPVVQGGPILNACSYGGSWVDTSVYPHAGSTADPLVDGDIQNAISRAHGQPELGVGAERRVLRLHGVWDPGMPVQRWHLYVPTSSKRAGVLRIPWHRAGEQRGVRLRLGRQQRL
jgi:hypothetical protein